jgi:hypothetical protein
MARIPRIQDWIKSRRAAGHDEFPFLRVSPEDNVLLGLQRIMSYLGMRSPVTLYKWIDLYGLPVVKRPDGFLMTTMTAIDQWVFIASEIEAEVRPRKSLNERLTRARNRLNRQFEERNAQTSMDGRPTESEAEEL